MTNPDQPDRVEHRMERSYEVAATPEQVWDAIPTADGISAWTGADRLDPQIGGAVSFERRHILVCTASSPTTHRRGASRTQNRGRLYLTTTCLGHPDRYRVPHRISVRRQLRDPGRHESALRKRSGLGERVLRRDDRSTVIVILDNLATHFKYQGDV